MINKRNVRTSCEEWNFQNSKGQYEAALTASGYQPNIKTDIGKTFLKLIKKHFKKDRKYHKILSRYLLLKINWRCSNLEKCWSHNKTLNNRIQQRPCNCRIKENCPMEIA